MKRIIAMVALLLLSSCNYVNRSSETINQSSNVVSSVASDSSLLTEPINNHDEAYYGHQFIQAEFVLYIGQENDYSQDTLTCRLTNSNDGFDSSVIIQEVDVQVAYAVFEDALPLEIGFDSDSMTANIAVEKTTYIVDFDNGTYKHEVKYRRQDLKEDNLVAQNKDGSLAIYETYRLSAGDSYYGDYVVLESKTGDMWFLVNSTGFNDPIFCQPNTVLICDYTSIKLVNAYTGELLPSTPKFDYQVSEDRFGYNTIGAAYDEDYEMILVAFRENTFSFTYDAVCEVQISVFNSYGEPIKTIDTGYKISPWHGIMPNPILFDFIGDGEALLSTYDPKQESSVMELGIISYW